MASASSFSLSSYISTGAARLGWQATSNEVKCEWLDPVGTVVKLAMLRFRDPGTKISIVDHDLQFDHVWSLPIQGLKRYYYGSSSSDLYNLVAPIYYSAVWLNPSEDEVAMKIFSIAREGIVRLIDGAYKDDMQVQQYLQGVHLTMIDKALSGEAIDPNQFRIPCWEENPLANASKEFWDKKKLQLIKDAFEEALENEKRGDPFDIQIDFIKGTVNNTLQKIIHLDESIRSGQSIEKASIDEVEYESSEEK